MNRFIVLLAVALLAGCVEPDDTGPAAQAGDDLEGPNGTKESQGVDPDDKEAPLMDRIEAAIERALRDA